MDLKNKIFNEIKELNFEKGSLWMFQRYHGVFCMSLNAIERREFPNVMKELCNEGIFEEITNSSVITYRLTDKGENVIWNQ